LHYQSLKKRYNSFLFASSDNVYSLLSDKTEVSAGDLGKAARNYLYRFPLVTGQPAAAYLKRRILIFENEKRQNQINARD